MDSQITPTAGSPIDTDFRPATRAPEPPRSGVTPRQAREARNLVDNEKETSMNDASDNLSRIEHSDYTRSGVNARQPANRSFTRDAIVYAALGVAAWRALRGAAYRSS